MNMLKMAAVKRSLGALVVCFVATAHAASPSPANDAMEIFAAQHCPEFKGGAGLVGESNGRAYSEHLLSVFRSHPTKSVGEVYSLISAKCEAAPSVEKAKGSELAVGRNWATEWPNTVHDHLAYFCGSMSADAMTPLGYVTAVIVEVERRMTTFGMSMSEAAQDIRANANCSTDLAFKGKPGGVK